MDEPMAHNRPPALRASAPRPLRAALAMAAALGAAGCAAVGVSDQPVPEWFAAKRAELKAGDYPSLAAIPAAPEASKPSPEWQAIEADLAAAGRAVLDNPKAKPAIVDDVLLFEREARDEADRADAAPE